MIDLYFQRKFDTVSDGSIFKSLQVTPTVIKGQQIEFHGESDADIYRSLEVTPGFTRGHHRSQIGKFQVMSNTLRRKLHDESNAAIFGTARSHQRLKGRRRASTSGPTWNPKSKLKIEIRNSNSKLEFETRIPTSKSEPEIETWNWNSKSEPKLIFEIQKQNRSSNSKLEFQTRIPNSKSKQKSKREAFNSSFQFWPRVSISSFDFCFRILIPISSL